MEAEEQYVEFSGTKLRSVLNEVKRTLGEDALIIAQEFNGNTVTVRACTEAAISRIVVDEVVDDVVDEVVDEMEDPVATDAVEETDRHVHIDTADESTHAPRAPDLPVFQPAQNIHFAGKPISQLRGIYRFVGVSGAGKSTSLIKVLCEWVLVNGTNDLRVITTDDQKLAGTEQLHLACDMLGVDLCEWNDATIERALPELRQQQLVLIDTPALELMARARRPVSDQRITNVLVCSASHSTYALNAQLQSAPQCTHLFLTHLDQPFDNLAIQTWLCQNQLPLSWLGSGAYIPGGVEVANQEAFDSYVPD